MRYEDASHTGAFVQGSEPDARNDADAIAAGAQGPATGNVITGEGTQTGPSGADFAAGAHITAIAGAGGEDSSFAGGKLAVSGEFGRLSIDAEGNYSYVAKAGTPENSRDRFTYTLADSQGNADTATLQR
jgi:large repetitive protein